jgi:predicted transcriptional regulator
MAVVSTRNPAVIGKTNVVFHTRPSAALIPAADPGLSPLARLGHDPRRAIGEDAIICLVCGHPFRQLTNSHLHSHGFTTEAYKRTFGYNARRPLMCRALRRLYAERSVRVGLAARIRERPIVVHPELRAKGGRRALAWEEVLTRFDARLRLAASRRRPPGRGLVPPRRLFG